MLNEVVHPEVIMWGIRFEYHAIPIAAWAKSDEPSRPEYTPTNSVVTTWSSLVVPQAKFTGPNTLLKTGEPDMPSFVKASMRNIGFLSTPNNGTEAKEPRFQTGIIIPV
ncbi:MAG: hypothetical protein ABJ059_00690 [Hyphomicrobiales bacterium]